MYNIGSAGAATEKFMIGDILHINSVIDYSQLLNTKSESKTLKPDILSNYKTESLATCDAPIISAEERAIVAHKASLIDMEGFAFVHACRMFNKKNYLFKIITDTPGNVNADEIILNMRKTRGLLYQFFMEEISDNS
jgi:nucleoside phosphorylase